MADIRSYGPGKYDRVIDAYAHVLTMDGSSENIGDVADTGWFGLIEGGDILADIRSVAKDENDELTEGEIEFLKDVVGYIVSENDQGFVTIDYYTDKGQLLEDWEKIKAEVEEVYAQSEED